MLREGRRPLAAPLPRRRTYLFRLAGRPENLLRLLGELRRKFGDGAELHAERQAMVDARRLLTFSDALGAQIAKSVGTGILFQLK